MQGFPIRALAGKLSSTGSCPWAVLSSVKGHINFVGTVFPIQALFIARKSPEFATLAPEYPWVLLMSQNRFQLGFVSN